MTGEGWSETDAVAYVGDHEDDLRRAELRALAQEELDAARRMRRAAAWPAERQRLTALQYAAKVAAEQEGRGLILEPIPVAAPSWWISSDPSPRDVAPVPPAGVRRDALGRQIGTPPTIVDPGPKPEDVFNPPKKSRWRS